MKQLLLSRLTLVLVMFALCASAAVAQKGKFVDERNVRAELGFLASDAMQGRGSASPFERIAAEYIGSQFMQFGLEPAGETGWDGKPSYVQSVKTNRKAFDGSPTLKYGSHTIRHGSEMLVLRASSEKLSGPLQKITLGETPQAGSVVFVKFGPTPPQSVMQALQGVITAGASMVIIEETPQYRNNWAASAGRTLIMGTAVAPVKPSAIIVVDTASAAAISALPAGTSMEFAGVAGAPQQTWNAIGKITGSDTSQVWEIILLSSHLDHLGAIAGQPAGVDNVFNGADDDASGSVAVLEMARVLASGKRPKRTVYFVCFGSEESGGSGARYFVENMPFPKEKLVANLEFEMIGRPDAAVKPEELWLTGYERSNLGPELAKRGAKLVQDPHPKENFFQRSDNIQLARAGVIAHTVSSFGLHTDYHKVSDELKTIDFTHMTHAIDSMVEPVIWLVNSKFQPTWVEGKKP
jgi:hypothetical protein